MDIIWGQGNLFSLNVLWACLALALSWNASLLFILNTQMSLHHPPSSIHSSVHPPLPPSTHPFDGIPLDPPMWYTAYFKLKASEQTVACSRGWGILSKLLFFSDLSKASQKYASINPLSGKFTVGKEMDHLHLDEKLYKQNLIKTFYILACVPPLVSHYFPPFAFPWNPNPSFYQDDIETINYSCLRSHFFVCSECE